MRTVCCALKSIGFRSSLRNTGSDFLGSTKVARTKIFHPVPLRLALPQGTTWLQITMISSLNSPASEIHLPTRLTTAPIQDGNLPTAQPARRPFHQIQLIRRRRCCRTTIRAKHTARDACSKDQVHWRFLDQWLDYFASSARWQFLCQQ